MATLLPKKILKGALTLVLVVSLSVTAVPRPAHALFGVGDTIDALYFTKEYLVDLVGWQLAEVARATIVKSIINWINGGFQGSPAFVTDLKQNLRGVEDAVASRLFADLTNNLEAATPFQNKVIDSVRLGYYLSTSPESFYTKNPYTLDQVSPDDEAFRNGDFSQGGWNAWFATVMNPQNNQFGAEATLDRVLTNSVSSASGQRLEELSWGKGFMSWRGDCIATKSQGSAADAVDLSGEDPCIDYAIRTPGGWIYDQGNGAVGSSLEKLISADELDEIIGALMNQLVSRVLGSGGGGGGLSGVSRPASGGGAAYIDQATASSEAGSGTPSANAPATGGTSLGDQFKTTLGEQKSNMLAYSAAWEKIRTEAQAAKQRCAAAWPPAGVISEATAALTKAANALTAIDTINAKIQSATAAGGDQTRVYAEVASDFNAIEFPSASEFARGIEQSGNEGTTLYTQMTNITSATCVGG